MRWPTDRLRARARASVAQPGEVQVGVALTSAFFNTLLLESSQREPMHAVTALAAVVFVCHDLQSSVRFYRALGVDVRETKHGGPSAGVVHYTCSLVGVHFALYPADGVERGPQSANLLGLMVTNLEGAIAAVTAVGGKLLSPASHKPWGMTAVLEDPDGRRIELVNMRSEVTGPMPF